MKNSLLIFLVLFIYSILSPDSSWATIYGPDDRKDPSEITDPQVQQLLRSVALIVREDHVMASGESYTFFKTSSYGEKLKLCDEENPFYNQPIAGHCSSFLVAEDIIATASHCFHKTYDCYKSMFVFDWNIDFLNKYQYPYRVPSSNIYTCKEIINYRYNEYYDFILIRLDRKVTDRKPFKIRRSLKTKIGEDLLIIGHPRGLPVKVSDHAKIFDEEDTYFYSDLDAFSGNSGSPVISADSKEVLGILIGASKSKPDFFWNRTYECSLPVVYDTHSTSARERSMKAAYLLPHLD